MNMIENHNEIYTENTKISDVISDSAFGNFGRLIFPVNSRYYSGDTLGELQLTWYNNIDASKTVEIANYMKIHAEAGETIFYFIYTEAEKEADPAKRDTGLFFFKGEPGAKFAICNAGGGFAYVGAMHDSFPHALELSKKGYNAFALIYRPHSQTACEDLARAISFIFEHAEVLTSNFINIPDLGMDLVSEREQWQRVGLMMRLHFGKNKCKSKESVSRNWNQRKSCKLYC